MIEGLDESEFLSWIETSLSEGTNQLASGYQGKTLLFDDGNRKLVIKVPHGNQFTRHIHIHLLRHEHEVYRKLDGYEWAPHCYGLIAGRYLVLSFIDGEPIRNRRPTDDSAYFDTLFAAVESLHDRGVAHNDLKRKDNLMVTADDRPCLIDFGLAIIKKDGFHPLNRFVYDTVRQFDYNAWVKHKYHENMNNISDDDRAHYRRTRIENIAGMIKQRYTKLKKKFVR